MIKEIWFLVFEFVHLDEWFNTLFSCKTIYNHLKADILLFVKRCTKNRINEIIDNLGNDFRNLMKENNAYITGSIFIELLLGKDKFKSNDLDIFMNSKEYYSTLHRFLYFESTGIESIYGKSTTWDDYINISKRVHHKSIEKEDGIQLELSLYKDRMITTLAFKNHITSVYSYKLENRKIQVINQNYLKNISKYIDEKFDFTIVKSFYNSHDHMKVSGVLDLYNRHLKTSNNYAQIVPFFSEHQIEMHKSRCEKYIARGFNTKENLRYGIYYKTLSRIIQTRHNNRISLEDIMKLIQNNSSKSLIEVEQEWFKLKNARKRKSFKSNVQKVF
jgi:hypothetical protein